ncbi:MAG: lyase family protein, partial [Candidatus Eisenbacteria bacterium]|nr:lyase family protein [Candidatus Eisenbacteria bacterium]
ANDVRWLGSGPRAGLGELILPAVQPGSSIMPGKVNPVMAEALMMVCVQVIGLDTAVSIGAFLGNLELNTMLPLLAHNLLQEIMLLSNGIEAFRARLLEGVTADRARIEALVEQSLALATALVPLIGYDAAARIAYSAHAQGRTIRDVARDMGVLPSEVLDRALDARRMTEPGLPAGAARPASP